MYEVGRVLRHRYDGYLKAVYDMNQILVKAPDVDRCIQSAMALTLGLFPPVPQDTIGQWNLVPIHSISNEVNNVSTYALAQIQTSKNIGITSLGPHTI